MSAGILAADERSSFTAGFAQTLAEGQTQPGWLLAARRSAFEEFVEQGWPTKKQEDWRFTDIERVTRRLVLPPPRVRIEHGLGSFAQDLLEIGGGTDNRVVFVDGRRHDGGVDPAGFVLPLSSALDLREEEVRLLLGRHLRHQNAFVSLNTAFMTDGAFVDIPPGVTVERPIVLVYLSSAEGHGSFPRTLVRARPGSRATIVELHLGASGRETWSSAVTEVLLEAGARVAHHSIQAVSPAGFAVSQVGVSQKADSELSTHSLFLGGGLVRNDVEVLLTEEGATCNLDGLYLASGEGHIDNHTVIDHRAPRTTSRESYRGAVGGKSRAVFNGRIVVQPGAQQVDARQSNRNLLLSDQAKVHSKPHLEIFANDVKCSHGATTGRLDQQALFYLRSRGLGVKDAEELLIRAFLFEGLAHVEQGPLRAELEGILGKAVEELASPAEEASAS